MYDLFNGERFHVQITLVRVRRARIPREYKTQKLAKNFFIFFDSRVNRSHTGLNHCEMIAEKVRHSETIVRSKRWLGLFQSLTWFRLMCTYTAERTRVRCV